MPIGDADDSGAGAILCDGKRRALVDDGKREVPATASVDVDFWMRRWWDGKGMET